MKILLIVTIFLSNYLFANYIYTDQNSGKIDMHGGKKENLLNQKNSISNINQIGIVKPLEPKKPNEPENLIKEDKKIKKEDKK
ncbi:hypothetical protein ACNSOS_03320 [Aliarcobacter vitoriensis]|uniref:Uncharacterized protein n=1 Tax=Aliarcobacter vitoriensis TaxID=2011099 RepID=A0A366MNZ2_9BACT|nr:hypothetical protein [Aliarcobacter vitoriensis]RBQ28001.1 hypothetical protein CRU91_11565 [Aliarcobacter vitoriensis]